MGVTATATGLPEKLILERNAEELEMGCINDCLCNNSLESCINAGDNELQVGEVIIRSPQYLETKMVATGGEGVYFGGFVCP